MKSYIVKKNHIGSAVSEILQYRHIEILLSKNNSYNLMIYVIDLNI